MVLKQKDAQIVDLITKSNGRLHKKDEEAKKKLSEKDAILQAAQKENEDAKKVIQQFRQRLVSFDNQIQENVKTFKAQLSVKEKELEDTKVKQSKERQTLVLECKGRVEAKEQLLRKKALEHGQKLLEKDLKWKESLTKAVEKVESAKKQVGSTLYFSFILFLFPGGG